MLMQPDRPDQYLTFREVAADIGDYLASGPVHYETVRRWASTGVRGVKLETVYIGGRRCVSRESLAEFFKEIGDSARQPRKSSKRHQTNRASQRQADAAMREIEERHFRKRQP